MELFFEDPELFFRAIRERVNEINGFVIFASKSPYIRFCVNDKYYFNIHSRFVPKKLLNALKQDKYQILISDILSGELSINGILQKEKIDNYYKKPIIDKQVIKTIKWWTEEEQLKAINYSVSVLKYIKEPSEKVKLEAIRLNGYAIQYIDNPSRELQLNAINCNGYVIRFIKSPSEEIKLKAVKKNGDAICYIKNPSREVQLEAVKRNGFAIKHIDNPSEEIQIAAIKKYDFSIKNIDNPSKEAQRLAIRGSEYDPEIFKFCPDFCEEDFRSEILLKRMLG